MLWFCLMYFQPREIIKIAEKIKDNKVGIFPFDTLLGLTGLATQDVVTKLESIKQRRNMAYIVIIGHLDNLNDFIEPLTDFQTDIINKYWPGPITFIFKKKASIPDFITAGKQTIGIRFSNFLPLNLLLTQLKTPILSTSANIHKQEVASTVSDISPDLLSQCDFGYSEILPRFNQCSTIVDISLKTPKILREGVVKFNG